MADETLGTLGVDITGDYQALQDAINQAQGVATSGATQIQGAFNGAAQSADTFAASSESVASASGHAGAGISEFRASLLELAEGLSATEAIKEFATDVLDAYDNVEQFNISLTALTGSGEKAAAMLRDVEGIATQIPVATASLLKATEQMTALGFSADQTRALLVDSANAALATGTSFDTVSQRLEQMISSGTVASRSLASLGLTTDDLVNSMKAAGVGAGVTATTISTAFKNLDVDTRMEVINAALQKFSGIGEQSAETVSGAWQILRNKWDEVLEAVGTQIAPLATKFIDFATGVVEAVGTAVDAFGKLPGPIKDLGLLAAGVLGASGPLLAGMAGLALAVQGLQSVPEVFAKITETLGLTSGAAAEAIPEVASFAAAEAAAGEAGLAAAPGITAFTAAERGAGEAAVGSEVGELGIAVAGAGEAAAVASPLMVAFGAAIAGWALTETISYLTDLGQKIADTEAKSVHLASAAEQTGAALIYANASSHALTGTLAETADAATKTGIALTMMLAPVTGVGNELNATATASKAGKMAFEELTAALEKHQAAVAADKEAVAIAQQQLDGSAQSVALLQAAEEKLTTDQKALTRELEGSTKAQTDFKKSLDGTDASLETVPALLDAISGKLQTQSDNLELAVAAWTKVGTDATASGSLISATLAKLDSDMKAAGLSGNELALTLQRDLANAGKSTNDLVAAWETAVSKFGAGSTQAKGAFDVLKDAFGTDTTGMIKSINDFVTNYGGGNGLVATVQNGSLVFTQQGQVVSQYGQAWQGLDAIIKSATGVELNLGQAVDGTVTVIRGSAAPVQEHVGLMQNLTQAHQQAAGAVRDTGAAMGAVIGTNAQLIQGTISLGQALQATGIDISQVSGGTKQLQEAASAAATQIKILQDEQTSLAAAFEKTGDPALVKQIALLQQEQKAAESALGAIQALASSQASFKTQANFGGQLMPNVPDPFGGTGQPSDLTGTSFAPGSTWGPGGLLGFAPFNPAPPTVPYPNTGTSGSSGVITSGPTGTIINGGGTDIPGSAGAAVAEVAQAFGALAPTLDASTASTVAMTRSAKDLEHQLTGGSTVPALDATTQAGLDLENGLTHATTNVNALAAAQASLTWGQGQAITSTNDYYAATQDLINLIKPIASPSTWDPLSAAQIELLASGQKLQTSFSLTGQQMAAVTDDVDAYQAALDAYNQQVAADQQTLSDVMAKATASTTSLTAALTPNEQAFQAESQAYAEGTQHLIDLANASDSANNAIAQLVSTLQSAGNSQASDLAQKAYDSAIAAGLSPAEAQQMAQSTVNGYLSAQAPGTTPTVSTSPYATSAPAVNDGYGTLGTVATSALTGTAPTTAPGYGTLGSFGILWGSNGTAFAQNAASVVPSVAPSSSGGTGGGGTIPNITVNMNGITPGNAQQLMNQFISTMRLQGYGKI